MSVDLLPYYLIVILISLNRQTEKDALSALLFSNIAVDILFLLRHLTTSYSKWTDRKRQ